MSTPYICQACRREFRRRALRLQSPQWPSRRTFISFTEIIPPKEDNALPSRKARQSRKHLPGADREKPKQADSIPIAVENESATPKGRYSRWKSRDFWLDAGAVNEHAKVTKEAGKSLLETLSPAEAMRLMPKPAHAPSPADGPHDQPQPQNEHALETKRDSPAKRLYELLRAEDCSAKDAWAAFQELYVREGQDAEALRKPSREDRQIIRDHQPFRMLLRMMCTRWSLEETSLPPPAAVVGTLHGLKLMGQDWYMLEVLEMLYRLIRFDTAMEGDAASREKLESQLLSLWAQFLRNCPSEIARKALPQPAASGEANFMWNGVPDPERLDFSKSLGRDAFRVSFRLHRLLEGVSPGSAQHLAAAALLTTEYFAHRYYNSDRSPKPSVNCEPFLNLMLRVLHGAQDFDFVASFSIELLEDQDVTSNLDDISTRLRKLHQRAYLATALGSLEFLGSESIRMTPEQEDKLAQHFYVRIKRQIERKNRGVIDFLWTQAQMAFNTVPRGNEDAPGLIPPDVYSAFLLGYRDIEDPQKQAEVWNHLLQSGHHPSQKQWGLLISARKKNINSLETVWMRMKEAGVHPDFQTWCVRISAHILNGDPEVGVGFLYTWGHAWYDDVSKFLEAQGRAMPDLSQLNIDGPTVPRPRTDTLTTAITALVQRKAGRGRRLDLVPEVFAWANQLAIKPSIWAYNALFRTCLKDGNLKEAMQILAKMEEDNVVPDEYTFYGFADYVFRQSSQSQNQKSPEEQFDFMMSVLGMLEQRGLQPNGVIFASMIDSLLKRHENVPNIWAAMTLLRIMLDKKIVVPAHIWTSFMTHYFQEAERQDHDGSATPNWTDIETLWRRMNQINPLILDVTFYDRMIEGYARFGDVDRAKIFLIRMNKEGKKPGWPALTALLSAYLEQGQTDQARDIVESVFNSTGGFQGGVRRTKNSASFRDRFFDVAVNAGLLDGGVYGGGARAGIREVEDAELADTDEQWKSLEDLDQRYARMPVDLQPGWDEVVRETRT